MRNIQPDTNTIIVKNIEIDSIPLSIDFIEGGIDSKKSWTFYTDWKVHTSCIGIS